MSPITVTYHSIEHVNLAQGDDDVNMTAKEYVRHMIETYGMEPWEPLSHLFHAKEDGPYTFTPPPIGGSK